MAASSLDATEETNVPPLRRDLRLHRGPDDPDGSPSYILEDPVAGVYRRVRWEQAQILARLRRPVTLEQLRRCLLRETTLRPSHQALRLFCEGIARDGLTRRSQAGDPGFLDKAARRARRFHPARAMGNLLFLRIPLLRPDGFLERTLPWVRPLGSLPAFILYGALSLLGVLLVLQRWEAFLETAPHFLSAEWAPVYALFLAGIRLVHEFAHAYTAKAGGCRVREMGIAFMVFFPIPFCDVTDTWVLRRRRDRIRVSGAGVLAELVIGGLALLGWGLLAPGPLRDLCFVAGSVSLLSTVLVNLNPGLRYDGYYVLSDLLGVDNLRSRAFNRLRWQIAGSLLGAPDPEPEPDLPPPHRRIMEAYALYAAAYRVLLAVTIALVVYNLFGKAVGGVLAFAEIVFMVVAPALREAGGFVEQWRRHWRRPRALLLAALLLAALCGSAIPFARHVSAPAVAETVREQVVAAGSGGTVRAVPPPIGTSVKRGDLLLHVESPSLEARLALAAVAYRRVQLERQRFARGSDTQALLPRSRDELGQARAAWNRLRELRAQNRVDASFDGVVAWREEGIAADVHVARRQRVARVITLEARRVRAYVSAGEVGDLSVGGLVRFRSDARPTRALRGRIRSIAPSRSVYLRDPGLGSLAGGALPARSDEGGRLLLLDAFHEVEIAMVDPAFDARPGQPGRIWFFSAPRSILDDAVRWLFQLGVRESGF